MERNVEISCVFILLYISHITGAQSIDVGQLSKQSVEFSKSLDREKRE